MKNNNITIGVVLGFIVLAIIVGLISLAITTAVVALVWNTFGLHNVFNTGELSFWGCVGIAFVIEILFGGPSVSVAR